MAAGVGSGFLGVGIFTGGCFASHSDSHGITVLGKEDGNDAQKKKRKIEEEKHWENSRVKAWKL